MDALLLQHLSSLQTVGHCLAGTDDGQVPPLHQRVGLAQLKIKVVVLIDVGNGITSHADIGGLGTVDKLLYQLPCLAHIAGQVDLHAGEGA